jgi:hypothetical protein
MLPPEENVLEALAGQEAFRQLLAAAEIGDQNPVEFIRCIVIAYEEILDSEGLTPEVRQNRLNGANAEAEDEVRRLAHAQ